MLLYIATSGQVVAMKGAETPSTHKRVYGLIDYPHMLESYHYIKKNENWIIGARKHGIKFFLDSGAFSAFNSGIEINLDQYAAFLHGYKDIICVASSLDDTSKNEQRSWDNQRALESLGCKVQPVFHAREDERWLVKYLDAGYDYIFLGGMVPEQTSWLQVWLDRLWTKYLTKADGTARVKVHGFGLTTRSLMFRYPWYSVDSTSWIMTAANGSVNLDLPRMDGSINDIQVDFSAKSPALPDLESWHYARISKPQQRTVDARLEQLEALRPKFPAHEEIMAAELGCKPGFNAAAFQASYGWRAWANIEYYRRTMERRVDRFVNKQDTFF